MLTIFLLVLVHTYIWDSTPDKLVRGNAEVRNIIAQFPTEKDCSNQRDAIMKYASKNDYFICIPASK